MRVLTEKGWRFLSNQPATSLAAMPDRPDELYAYRWNFIFGAADHFRSRDMGRTWQKIELGPGNGIRVMAGRQTPSGTLLGGTTWQRLSASPGYYLKLYPTDPDANHIFAIRNVLYESNDGGVTWKNISRQVDPHLTWSDLAISAMTNPYFLPWFISTRFGLYYRD